MRYVQLLPLLALLSLAASWSSGPGHLWAGAARVNITPPPGTIINEDFLPGYTREIHEPLYARALAFDNGARKFVFVVVDNMTPDILLINNVKEIVGKATGLKIKKNVKSKYYCTITLASGQFGYVPTEKQLGLGGYETWLCSGI